MAKRPTIFRATSGQWNERLGRYTKGGDWGFVLNGQQFLGFRSKQQATDVAQRTQQQGKYK